MYHAMEWVASLAGCIKSRANTYINRWMEVEFIVATASTYQYLFNSLFFHIAADPGIASSLFTLQYMLIPSISVQMKTYFHE